MHPRAAPLLGKLRRDRRRWSWAVVVALLLAVLAPQRLPAMPELLAGAICAAGGEHDAPPAQHHDGQPDCCVIACAGMAPALGVGPEPMALRLPGAAMAVALRAEAVPPAVPHRLGAASPRGPPAAG